MKTPRPDFPDVLQIHVPSAVSPTSEDSVPLCTRLRTASLLTPSAWAAFVSVTLRVRPTVAPYVRSYIRGYIPLDWGSAPLRSHPGAAERTIKGPEEVHLEKMGEVSGPGS